MLSQAQVRSVWGKRCSGTKARITLHGGGVVVVAAAAAPAVLALNAVLVAANYKTRAKDTGAYNCRKVAGSSVWSLHSWGIAVDINWQTNPMRKPLKTDFPSAMVKGIEGIRTRNGRQIWRWGGTFSTPDAMHFEIVCSPADLASGIDSRTLPRTPTSPASPANPSKDDDMVEYVRVNETGAIFAIAGEHYRHIGPQAWAARQWIGGVKTTQDIKAADFMSFVAATKLIELPASA